MKQLGAIAVLLLSVCVVRADTNDLGVARAALRDGLWEIARAHAAKIPGDDGRLITLESYARERRWGEVAAALDAWPDATNELFACYRAAALAEAGEGPAALEIVNGQSVTNDLTRKLAAMVRAKVAADEGRPGEAAKFVSETVFSEDDYDGRAYLADLLAASGDRAGAEREWRKIIAKTPPSKLAYLTAAVNLGDIAALSNAYVNTTSSDLRRKCGLRFGMVMLESKDTFAAGEKLIRAIVKDMPDAEGAADAFETLADKLTSAGRWQEAADAYRDMLETWPQAAKRPSVHDGHGWALAKLGQHEEALAAFERAEAVATNGAVKASAIMKQGDVLAETGRGTESMAKYREVLTKYPNTPVAEKLARLVRIRERESQGREAYAAGDYATAEKAFAEVAVADPSRATRMEYLTALCRYGQGRDGDAAARMDRLAANLEDPAVRLAATQWLAKLSFNRGAWKESARLFAEISTNAPADKAAAALLWSARASYADGDFKQAVLTVTDLAARFPTAAERMPALLVQGEALIELARFDEAVLVLDLVAASETAATADRERARLLRADALYALGADDPARYRQALEAYGRMLSVVSLTPSERLQVAYKEARTLEKLKRLDEALDRYYSNVVIAYRDGRQKGIRYTDDAQAAFARAAFRLADEYEDQGRDYQARRVLELVVKSGVPAKAEASRRLTRLSEKGRFL